MEKYPIRDENNKFIWKNLFVWKRDWKIVLFVVWTCFMSWAYIHDTEQCFEIVENPIGFCEKSNACYFINQNKSVFENYNMNVVFENFSLR